MLFVVTCAVTPWTWPTLFVARSGVKEHAAIARPGKPTKPNKKKIPAIFPRRTEWTLMILFPPFLQPRLNAALFPSARIHGGRPPGKYSIVTLFALYFSPHWRSRLARMLRRASHGHGRHTGTGTREFVG